MQLKALAAILSVACTIGVQAAPNPLDRGAHVKSILKRSYSHGKDMSQVSKRAVALVAKKRDSNHHHHAAKNGKQCQPKTTQTTPAPQSQQSQTTPTPEQPQPTPISEQSQTTPTPEQPQTTPTPEQPQPTSTPEAMEPQSSPAPEVTPSANVGGNNTSLDSLSQQWLDLHNQARAQYGAAPMTWDSDLAAYAQNYGKNCVFKHSGGPHGENLAAQTGGLTPADSVNMWMDEAGGYALVDSLRIKMNDYPLTVHLLDRRL